MPDVLGSDYQLTTLPMADDYEGAVVASLVVRRAAEPTGRAVLYIHGFTDYFFQTHLAEHFVAQGTDFYGLDLRKYGRSLLPHQTRGLVRSVTEYFPEIDEAIRIIREEDGHDEVIINAHSTGGLIAALWADRVRGRGLVQGLVLNSPFLDLNVPAHLRVAADVLRGPLSRMSARTVLPLGSGHRVRHEPAPRPSRRVGLRPGVEADRRVPGARGLAGRDPPGTAQAPRRPRRGRPRPGALRGEGTAAARLRAGGAERGHRARSPADRPLVDQHRPARDVHPGAGRHARPGAVTRARAQAGLRRDGPLADQPATRGSTKRL